MSNQAIYRLANRLRKNQDRTYRVMVDKMNNLQTIETTPEVINEAIDAAIEHLETIRQQAQLVEVYKDKEKEGNEVLVGVVQDLANMSTILGGEGQSLKILTHFDPVYIKGVMIESDDAAFAKAIENMNEDELLLFKSKLNSAGIILEK